MNLVRLAIFVAIALLMAIGHGAIARATRPAPPPRPAPATSAEAGGTAPAVAQGRKPHHRDSLLTAAQIHALIEEAAIVVVDARPADQYRAGHMPSAFHLPFEAFRRGRPRILDYIMPEERILIYCGGGDCEASHMVQEMLQEYGYMNSEVYLPGWPGWLEYGGPIDTGGDTE